jgi:hypothetical protein
MPWSTAPRNFRHIHKIVKSDYTLHHIWPSVCPSIITELVGSQRADFCEINIRIFFWKSVEKIQVSLKSDKNEHVLYTEANIRFCSYLAQFLERNFSDKSCAENPNTHFMFSNFSPKIVLFMRWCGKIPYSRTGNRQKYGAYALQAW